MCCTLARCSVRHSVSVYQLTKVGIFIYPENIKHLTLNRHSYPSFSFPRLKYPDQVYLSDFASKTESISVGSNGFLRLFHQSHLFAYTSRSAASSADHI